MSKRTTNSPPRAGNANLRDSKRGKTDEFYTQLSLIENEMKYYRGAFQGKTVLCNCDDPYESEFFRFFALNFNNLGLKKLIATCYKPSPIAQTELLLPGTEAADAAAGTAGESDSEGRQQAYKVEITEVGDFNGDGRVDLLDLAYLLQSDRNASEILKGDGDFKSPECVEFLKEADVVVTNPPFSLFREYVALLMKHEKKFIIIGNMNAITYGEIFPLIAQNKIWLGNNSGHFWFKVPPYYEEKKTDFKIDETGQKWRRMGNICWFTNIDIEKRHKDLALGEFYDPAKYPKYDNYDAIEVPTTAEIPCDYYGVMGVPITFLDKYNPDQFEILELTKRGHDTKGIKTKIYTKFDYPNFNDLNVGPVLIQPDGTPKSVYTRVMIRRRRNENPGSQDTCP